jgi:hypothetical protein
VELWAGRGYLPSVVTRFRTLLLVVVAGLLGPTMAAAASETHCAGYMAPATPGHPCPCCPDADRGMAGCLVACGANIGVSSSVAIFQVPVIAESITTYRDVTITRASDPPLKPPPIV